MAASNRMHHWARLRVLTSAPSRPIRRTTRSRPGR